MHSNIAENDIQKGIQKNRIDLSPKSLIKKRNQSLKFKVSNPKWNRRVFRPNIFGEDAHGGVYICKLLLATPQTN